MVPGISYGTSPEPDAVRCCHCGKNPHGPENTITFENTNPTPEKLRLARERTAREKQQRKSSRPAWRK